MPCSLGARFVTPLASPQAARTSSTPSIPFQEGAFLRPEREVDPVPWALDTKNFAEVDSHDSLAEGLVLTPGYNPYAST